MVRSATAGRTVPVDVSVASGDETREPRRDPADDKGLISGTICAGGSLGTIIPPSVVVVILGPVADVDVGGLFMGMLFPGLMLALLYILVRCIIRPQDGQRLSPDENDPPLARKLVITAVALVPPVILIFAVLGTILLGWATPTEAAAMGALGSIVMVVFYRNFSLGVLKEALVKTLLVTAMILMILLAGNIFATVFTIAGGLVTTQNLVESACRGGRRWPCCSSSHSSPGSCSTSSRSS